MAGQGEEASDAALGVDHLYVATRCEMVSAQGQERVDARAVGERQTNQVDPHHADVSGLRKGPGAQQVGAEEVEFTVDTQEQARGRCFDVEAKGALVSLV